MKCPNCGSNHVRRSRVRLWEVPLKPFTKKRPHRCGDCRWRGWVVHEHRKHGAHPRLHSNEALVPPQADPDLSAIDSSIRGK